MNPTEHHDPQKQDHQTSSEEQSNSQGAGNTQATHSNDAPPPYTDHTPIPLPPGLNVPQLPEYSPSPAAPSPETNEAPPPYPGPPTAPQPYYSPDLVRFFNHPGADEARVFMPFSNHESHSSDEEEILPLIRNQRSRQSMRAPPWFTILKAVFALTAIILLLDSILAEFTAGELARDVRGGIYNQIRSDNKAAATNKNSATEIYDPCHLHGAPSLSFSSAYYGATGAPLCMIALKLICFPIIMFITAMELFCPNMLHNLLHTSGTPIGPVQPPALEMAEVNANGNAQQEGPNDNPSGEPENTPSGELEDASSSQSNSRERN